MGNQGFLFVQGVLMIKAANIELREYQFAFKSCKFFNPENLGSDAVRAPTE